MIPLLQIVSKLYSLLTFLVVSDHSLGDSLTNGVYLRGSSTTLDSDSDINL